MEIPSGCVKAFLEFEDVLASGEHGIGPSPDLADEAADDGARSLY